MKIYFITIMFIICASCKNESTSVQDAAFNGTSSKYLYSNSEIQKLTERLRKSSPNEKNISHYKSLIRENISLMGQTMHEIDSLFHLIDSMKLKTQTQFSVNRTRLLYLNVIKDVDSAEVLTRSLYKTTDTIESMYKSDIDYELFYNLTYIKALKSECDSAVYFNKMLNSTIEQDSSMFHEIQLENVRWINTWLKKQCEY